MKETQKNPVWQAYWLYARLGVYVKPFWLMLFVGITANLLASIIDAGFTYLMRPFLDKGFIHLDMDFVRRIPMIILIGVTIRGLTTALGNYCMTWVARAVINVLRQQLFAHILRLPASYYDAATSGQLLSKILYNVEQVAQVSADALTDLVQNTCLVIGLLTVMFLICWQLSLMFLLSIPLVGLLVNYTNKRIRKISHHIQLSMAQVTEIASEAIDGYQVVRLFGAEEHERVKFKQATEQSRQQDMKVAMSKAINVFGVQCIIAAAIAMIIFYSIQMASVIQVTAGSFLAIIAAMLQLVKPMKTLASLNATFQRGLAGAESVFALLDEPVEKTVGTTLTARAHGDLQFKAVSHAHNPGLPVLHDVSFTLRAGQTVALVGHSGSGKSTIASLVARFYAPTAGQILLDGVPIEQLSLASLRAQMALVSQQVTLFNDTVFNNIAYANPHASREAVRHAATLAHAHEFIEQLPHGYNTRIGEQGVLLSGGQRQRLAIARALFKDAPLLILDEATSALDTLSERLIMSCKTVPRS